MFMKTEDYIAMGEWVENHSYLRIPSKHVTKYFAEIEQLQEENERLKKKIEVVCKGMSPPKFNPQSTPANLIDLTDPESVFLYGWGSAVFECGEILSKP